LWPTPLVYHTVLKIEKTTISATKVACKLKKLKQSLEERGNNKFIPQEAKMLFRELEETGNINTRVHRRTCFYAKCISYTEMWEGNFQEAESFSCANPNYVKWPKVETTAELVNIKMGQSPVNIDQIFDKLQ
jgi:hypothetical protein